MIKYLHIRKVNSKGQISSHGGLTIAYTCTLTEIIFQKALCNDSDLFCYDLGRRIAEGRLRSKKIDPEIIALTHPIIQTLVDWIAANICDVPIEIVMDAKHRWISDFMGIESDFDWKDQMDLSSGLTGLSNDPIQPLIIPDDAYMDRGEMRYDG